MRRKPVLMIAIFAVLSLLAAACSSDSDSTTTTTEASPTSDDSGGGGGEAGGTQVSTFSIASDVHCSGDTVDAKAEWTSRDANSAKIEVDGTFESEDLPANGSTDVEFACDDSTHRVVLEVVSADGDTAAAVHEVRTEPDGDGSGKPVIDSFTVSVTGCTGSDANVSATYTTTDAETVGFEIDGEAPGAQAGLPTSGTENVPDVPCDGTQHQITLFATNSADQSVQKTQTVTSPSS